MKRTLWTALTIPLISIIAFACAKSSPSPQTPESRTLFQAAEDPSAISQILVTSKTKLVMVDFYSPRCPYCKKLAPILDQVARMRQDGVKYYKVDIDAQKEIASHFKAWPIPYVLFLKDGREVKSVRGVHKKSRYREEIDELLTNP